jgi:Mn-dependent DtxR family transcriptional regulator
VISLLTKGDLLEMMSKTESRVFEMLKMQGNVGPTKIAQAMGKNPSTVQGALASLQRKGILKKTGVGSYEVVREPHPSEQYRYQLTMRGGL